MRFTYEEGPFEQEGILLRLPDGRIRAHTNECRHLAVPLDDRDPGGLRGPPGRHPDCAVHGALNRPEDSLCITGPCRGSHLRGLSLTFEGDSAWLDTSKIGCFFT